MRDGRFVSLSREEDPREWERLVASDDAIATQIKDGMWPVSSSSAPSIMAEMIDALELSAGMRVLEIGTGTGYNAACMAALGAEVVSVEIDREAADHARDSLRAAGHSDVVVITGNGEVGAPAHGPFDRVIATAAAHTLPHAWVKQTKAGGLIVVPWAATFRPDGPLAILKVNADATAEGRFTAPAWFMPLRGQGLPQAVLQETEERWIKAGRPDCTRYGITVTPTGQVIWLDSPDSPIDR
ncbi:protein-L-isoaspartate O-methyltransferase [Actinomadura sp. 6N118]|uniref:protein-L-isoaspartate O-methyltransferase n=1 Tax=Actinomadura sp. 6N118 TaxID=3375151 RepID=UPI00378AB774